MRYVIFTAFHFGIIHFPRKSAVHILIKVFENVKRKLEQPVRFGTKSLAIAFYAFVDSESEYEVSSITYHDFVVELFKMD